MFLFLGLLWVGQDELGFGWELFWPFLAGAMGLLCI